jgi:glycosyl transferase family 1
VTTGGAASKPRVLFVSPIDMQADNGMARRQQQLLDVLCGMYPDSVDVLSLAASFAKSSTWLRDKGFQVNLLRGIYPLVARWNATAWYGCGAILCNKLQWIDRFYFPLRTPLPQSWWRRYDLILCFYPWLHRLLRLERGGAKVIVDTGDIMADRHERTGARRWISLTAKDERDVLESGSRCLAISKDDSDEFHRLYGVRLPVISFVPPDYNELLKVASHKRPTRVGFMGAPSYVNEEILRALSEPYFLKHLSNNGIELFIAGGICRTAAPSVLEALERGGAKILGRISSTADYYRQISVTVNPVGPSTGVKIKSIETLVAGCSLITTRWGADAMVAAAFPGQISYIEWPVDAKILGEMCVDAVQNSNPDNRDVAKRYIQNTTDALKEMLSR